MSLLLLAHTSTQGPSPCKSNNTSVPCPPVTPNHKSQTRSRLGLYMPWAYDSVHMAHRNRDLMLSVLKDLLMPLMLAEEGP